MVAQTIDTGSVHAAGGSSEHTYMCARRNGLSYPHRCRRRATPRCTRPRGGRGRRPSRSTSPAETGRSYTYQRGWGTVHTRLSSSSLASANILSTTTTCLARMAGLRGGQKRAEGEVAQMLRSFKGPGIISQQRKPSCEQHAFKTSRQFSFYPCVEHQLYR